MLVRNTHYQETAQSKACYGNVTSSTSDKQEWAIFIWGFGKYGQLGTGSDESKGTPRLVKLEKNDIPLTLSCGGHHTIICVKNEKKRYTKVLACGRGLYGRLGTGDEKDQTRFHQMAEPGPDGWSHGKAPSHIAAGHWHSAYVTSDGDIYMWGYNKSHGVMGGAGLPPIVSVPTHIKASVCFTTISCGFNYTLAVSSDHVAYSWGCGKNGVLGHGDREDRAMPTPVKMGEANTKVCEVSGGYCHTAFVTLDGNMYTCGKGVDGALCQGKDKREKLLPTLVDSLAANDCLVRSASCSQGEHHAHTLIVTSVGVYSCGDGYKGKLGLGDDNSVDYPTIISSSHFGGATVTRVCAGGIHSTALAPDVGVFVWGCGSDGRLGLPEAIGHRYLFRSNVPRKVDLGPWKPTQVSCSYYHTAVLCQKTSI